MTDIVNALNSLQELGVIGSPSDSFEATVDILGVSSNKKLLGELVMFVTPENQSSVVSLGQITDIVTENKWHEEPAFKSVIKRHGILPHLSGYADNRIAKLTVQSSFIIEENNFETAKPYKLANSPSTGSKVVKMSNLIMGNLLKKTIENKKIEELGCAYGTDVKIPFWFKHFGDGNNGANDAYHIGVFGKTGSGKTSTAAQMLKGYASNSDKMSILILDPQEQFFKNQNVLPKNKSFKDEIINCGMKYHAVKIPDDIYLPDDPELFAELLNSSGFIRKMFALKTEETKNLMSESISNYIQGRKNTNGFDLGNQDSKNLLKQILERFLELKHESEQKDKYSTYISNVYIQKNYRDKLKVTIENKLQELSANNLGGLLDVFDKILKLFQKDSNRISLYEMVDNVVGNSGQVYIVNLSPKGTQKIDSVNIQALLIKLITRRAVEIGEELWSEGKKSNCLIVMDEAHRYVNPNSSDERVQELSRDIVDAVRTTRKYGVGYMFITQTIESIDDEIIQQMRIFAFGYGLTMGREFSKIKQIINDDNATKFYRSFIDPSSNGKYPFMFHGPISPLSFTGSPLFIEMT